MPIAIGEFARLPFHGIPKNFNVYLKKAAIQVTIERTKFVQIANVGGSVGDNVGDNVGGRNTTKLTDRQKNILNRLIETEQMNVLENVLETSASLVMHFKVDARTISAAT